jgi:Fe-S-cluster containining protein
MSGLVSIQEAVGARVAGILEARGEWPCRKGCDDCCRRLASVPLVSGVEWSAIEKAIEALPGLIAETVRQRVQESAAGVRPFTCPLLDREAGACLVYEARPVQCRTYGFYAERDKVLGCERIEAVACEDPGVVWGNHRAVEAGLAELGPARPLHEWL